jgi:DNA polymerase-3 subunit beta
VATDGHRLAMSELILAERHEPDLQVIVPRKAVLELFRLLDSSGEPVNLCIGNGQIRVELDSLKLTSKLVDGRFPEYERVVPEGSDKLVRGDRVRIRSALSRAAILSNEKFRGVRLLLSENLLRIQTHNPEQEEAEEEVEVEYRGSPLEIGFNVSYLLDALDVIEGNEFSLELRGPDSSGLLYDSAQPGNKYVVMPMRL